MRIALALFVYNRPDHTRRTVEALAANRGATSLPLLIFSDGPVAKVDVPLVEEVRSFCRSVAGFSSAELICREKHLGLASSIRAGVDQAFEDADVVIVLEDDLITSPFFLRYMQTALETYEQDPRLLSVSAYMPPRLLMSRRGMREDVWLSLRNLSFGWGVWKDRWESVEWDLAEQEPFVDRPDLQQGFARGGADLPFMMLKQLRGETDSWAIHFSYAHFRQQRYSLMPRESYVKPIGFDGSGVHCRPSPVAWLSTTRHAVCDPVLPSDPMVRPELQKRFQRMMDLQFRAARMLGRV